MPEISWTDTAEIAISLLESHPDVDPLSVRFTDLHRWVMELGGFTGDAKDSNEKKLEAIQMAWYEEWQDSNEKFRVRCGSGFRVHSSGFRV